MRGSTVLDTCTLIIVLQMCVTILPLMIEARNWHSYKTA